MSKSPKKPVKPARAVKWPEFATVDAFGPDALTEEKMKEILGWREVAGKEGAQFKDQEGKWVTCYNNDGNRPIDVEWALTLAQDILNKNWAGPNGTGGTPNGETVILGKTGRVLSAQHRLVGGVFACQLWRKHPHWKDLWETPPVLDTLLVVGVDEDRKTTRTHDNVKARTLADVLFADEKMFGDLTYSQRTKLCTVAGHAIAMLWHRTGASKDAFTPRQTHAEAVDWLDRHRHLGQAVRHVYEEDGGEGRVRKYLSPGYASALLYLMGCSASDGDRDGNNQLLSYLDARPAPNEKPLDWSLWERACEFWTLLAGGAKDMDAVRTARRPVDDGADEYSGLIFTQGEGGGSRWERMAVLCKAWAAFREGRKPTKRDVKMDWDEYTVTRTDDGVIDRMVYRLNPTVGGIDLGGRKETDPSGEGEAGGNGVEEVPTPEEVEGRKAELGRLPDDAGPEEERRLREEADARKRQALDEAKARRRAKQSVPTRPGRKPKAEADEEPVLEVNGQPEVEEQEIVVDVGEPEPEEAPAEAEA